MYKRQAIILSCPSASRRINGTINVGLVQDDGGISWDYTFDVTKNGTWFAYSSMTELPDGSIGILYETKPVSYTHLDVYKRQVQPRAYAGEAVQRNYSDYLDRVEVPSEGSATFEGSTFGLTGFERLAKGTARSVDGAPEGYRIPLSDQASVVVIRTPEMTLVHIDEGVAQQLGLYPFVSENDSVLWSMICLLYTSRCV